MKKRMPLYLIACWIITYINVSHTYLLPPLFTDKDKKPEQPNWQAFKDFFSPKQDTNNESSTESHDVIPSTPTEKLALNKTPNFGKKHFIIGYGPYIENEKKQQKKPAQSIDIIPRCDDGRICSAFFSPEDKIRKKLINLFEREQKQIRIAVFHFTDKKVAQALIDAKNRGVNVEIIVDPGCGRDRFNKLDMLTQNNINVYVYDPQAHKNFFVSLMHHKFIVLDENVYGKALTITGSFNLTKAAHVRNKENVVILDETKITKQFIDQFNGIKKQSNLYKTTSVAQLETDSLNEQI